MGVDGRLGAGLRVEALGRVGSSIRVRKARSVVASQSR